MESIRAQILKDLGPCIPEVTFEWFKSAVLPHVDRETLEAVCYNLKEENILEDNKWFGLTFKESPTQKKKTQQRKEEQEEQVQGKEKKDEEEQKEEEEQGEQAKRARARTSKNVHEDTFFAPLATHFNSIIEFLQKIEGKNDASLEGSNGKQTDETGNERVGINFSSSPTKSLRSEGSHGRYKADINAFLDKTTAAGKKDGENYECDVVMTGEYKKAATADDRDKNVSHLVGNINHLMGSDPTRRFMFGMTVERTDLRLWFFSRSHVFVTEVLDLQKNAEDLVYFVLALGSARKVELGFDHTVKRYKQPGKTGKIVYRYKVGEEWYEVVEAVSIHKAKFVLGRANRVFKVKRVLETGALEPKILFLKDAWIPEGAKTELQILEHIKENINKVNVVEGLKPDEFDRHFVSIEHCGPVKVPSMSDSAAFVDDNSSNFLRNHRLPSKPTPFPLTCRTNVYANGRGSRPLDESVMSASTGGTLSGSVESTGSMGYYATTGDLYQMNREHYGNKVHCRELMEDAGKTMEEIRNWRTIFTCLKQVIKALEYMHSAGYVHRDISTGNILVDEKPNGEVVCKLSDLEYGKDLHKTSNSMADVKTGTPYFMAIEVARRAYLFLPTIRSFPIPGRSRAQKSSREKEATAPPFQYNYLHDIESVFWIVVFFLAVTRPEDEVDSETKSVERYKVINSLFISESRTWERDSLVRGTAAPMILKALPECFQPIWDDIASLWAEWLRTLYEEVEKSLPFGNSFYPALYSSMQDSLENVLHMKEDWNGVNALQLSLEDALIRAGKRKAVPGITPPELGSPYKKARIEPVPWGMGP